MSKQDECDHYGTLEAVTRTTPMTIYTECYIRCRRCNAKTEEH